MQNIARPSINFYIGVKYQACGKCPFTVPIWVFRQTQKALIKFN